MVKSNEEHGRRLTGVPLVSSEHSGSPLVTSRRFLYAITQPNTSHDTLVRLYPPQSPILFDNHNRVFCALSLHSLLITHLFTAPPF